MKFKPQPKSAAPRQYVQVIFMPDEFARVETGAKAANLSKAEFCRQAVLFALDNADTD